MASKTEEQYADVDPVPPVRKPLNPIQQHLVAASGEFVGTFFFLYLSYAGNIMAVSQAPSTAPGGGLSSLTVLIISMVYGFSLLVNVWAFYRISGGLFNPAVSSRYSPADPVGAAIVRSATTSTSPAGPSSVLRVPANDCRFPRSRLGSACRASSPGYELRS